jgi:hypothetical protein
MKIRKLRPYNTGPMRHKFLMNNEYNFSPHTIRHRFKNGGTTFGRDDSHHNDTQHNAMEQNATQNNNTRQNDTQLIENNAQHIIHTKNLS